MGQSRHSQGHSNTRNALGLSFYYASLILLSQHGKSNLLLLTDHPDPRLIFFSYSTPSSSSPFLKALKTLSLYHHHVRPSEYLHSVTVDPSGRVALVNCYTGKIKVVEIEDGLYTNDFDVM
jgi:DNA damage-binding protein 1